MRHNFLSGPDGVEDAEIPQTNKGMSTISLGSPTECLKALAKRSRVLQTDQTLGSDNSGSLRCSSMSGAF